jgi:hypothetical protein
MILLVSLNRICSLNKFILFIDNFIFNYKQNFINYLSSRCRLLCCVWLEEQSLSFRGILSSEQYRLRCALGMLSICIFSPKGINFISS